MRRSLGTLGIVTLGAACGRGEGHSEWEAALHASAGAAAPRPGADEAYPVPAAPFSAGIFPCSRCHEGGTKAVDKTPSVTHARHLGRGLECADCHWPESDEVDPKLPSPEVCQQCHSELAKQGKEAQAYFAAVTATDGTITFPRRWHTRDVNPQHARHTEAGIECATCHGEPTDSPFVKPKPVTNMARCSACHDERKVANECTTCHRETTKAQHENIVLHHAEQQRWCLDCHDPDDRDRLRLANGTQIGFDESFKLCGQCHGTQFRDWRVGLHGKRTGSWNGRKEYRLCVHCHYPHEPRFAPMTAVALPLRPEDVR